VIWLAKNKNTIYDNLNSFTLGNVPASNVNNQQEPVNIMKVNEDRLDQLNRINKSLFRDGNPMPNTMKIVSVTLSEEDTVYTVLQPAKGEVWMLQQATYKRNSGSSSAEAYLSYFDGTTTASFLYINSSTSTENILTSDDNYAGNTFYFDNNCYFIVERRTGGGGNIFDLICTFARVR
jgi:hypothetical protein